MYNDVWIFIFTAVKNFMEKCVLKVKKLRPDAKLPTYGSDFAAGADLYACLDSDVMTFEAGETKFVHTGISMEIPEGLVGLVYARSGLASKRGLAPANKVGVVDCDYRGEIMVSLHNHSTVPQSIENGERVAQIVLTPYIAANIVESDNLSETSRGTGGFGSTGTK